MTGGYMYKTEMLDANTIIVKSDTEEEMSDVIEFIAKKDKKKNLEEFLAFAAKNRKMVKGYKFNREDCYKK
jgi:hypothetical protein